MKLMCNSSRREHQRLGHSCNQPDLNRARFGRQDHTQVVSLGFREVFIGSASLICVRFTNATRSRAMPSMYTPSKTLRIYLRSVSQRNPCIDPLR